MSSFLQNGACTKWGLAPIIPKASLSSPSERNHARSAFLTVFSPYSHRHARNEKKGTGYFFSKKEKVSTHGQNNRKSSLSPFSPSMSEPRELRRRQEERMENGVKNLKGARLFPKTISNSRNGDAC
jgi:hypothetical protein